MALYPISQEILPIVIKGTPEGILVTVAESAAEGWLDAMEAEFAKGPEFWRGGRVILCLGNRELQDAELADAVGRIERYGMRLGAVQSENDETKRVARELSVVLRAGAKLGLTGLQQRPQETPAEAEEPEPEPEEAEAIGGVPALILKETLRSGRSVRHAGPVIVVGDVNPGAEVHAGGDVIVWGKLRGLVHAGAPSDRASVVCALDLNPTQLRIADKITIPPKDPKRQPVPEMAIIRDEQIVAEPWRSKG